MQGLVHIYTGDGKGKTTAALGLGIRAYGRGFKVLMVQFLKSADTGELKTLEMLKPGFDLIRTDEIKGFVWNMNEQEKQKAKEIINRTFYHAVEEAISQKWDLIILDEIMASITNGMLPLDSVTNFIKSKPISLEIVLTGRNTPQTLIDLADYVSEINELKHPFHQGVKARKGIEF